MELKERFLHLPVSINNYYGDPVLQWKNTLKKIEKLINDGHKGVIAILTRGYLSKEKVRDLESFSYKKLVIIPPISHLEGVEINNHEERYRTIENALGRVQVIPNIRPLIKGKNDDKIDYIFKRLSEIGIDKVICSGIRGNDEILLRTGITKEEKEQYCLRVKIIPAPLRDALSEASVKYSITVAKRVSCGIALLFGEPSHNPYWKSPHLAGCYSCPLKEKCYNVMVRKMDMPEHMPLFLDKLGYEWRRVETDTSCQTPPDRRLDCPSCCTACYMHGYNTIFIDNKPISLGTLSFLRFLFRGFTFTHTGIQDTGAKDTAVVYLPNLKMERPPEAINSWYVLANQTNFCFGCSYCIVDAYSPEPKEHGVFPMELYKRVESIL